MRLIAVIRETNAKIRGGFATLIGVYVFDALFMSIGAIALLVGFVMLIFAFRDMAKERTRARATIAAYALLVAAVIGTNLINDKIARRRADRIIAAVAAYKSDTGHYPRVLADLVPRYLETIPVAKYTIGYNRFLYWNFHDSRYPNLHPQLMYVVVSPFGRRFYDFETHSWYYLD